MLSEHKLSEDFLEGLVSDVEFADDEEYTHDTDLGIAKTVEGLENIILSLSSKEQKDPSDCFVRTKNEISYSLSLPNVEIKLTDTDVFIPAGEFESIVKDVVLVNAQGDLTKEVLDMGTFLFNNEKQVIGEICDTLGPIKAPVYAVMMDDRRRQKVESLKRGDIVYYTAKYANIVSTTSIKGQFKSSDASNMWDEEVAESNVDFSDDEEELRFKQQLKLKKQNKNKNIDMINTAPGTMQNPRQEFRPVPLIQQPQYPNSVYSGYNPYQAQIECVKNYLQNVSQGAENYNPQYQALLNQQALNLLGMLLPKNQAPNNPNTQN